MNNFTLTYNDGTTEKLSMNCSLTECRDQHVGHSFPIEYWMPSGASRTCTDVVLEA